jgi:tetratricopeptide (TPR) repeat protein
MRNPTLLCALLIPWMADASAVAEEAGLEALIRKSAGAMEAENWREALDLSNQAVTRFGQGDARKSYGAQFGAVHYRKGLCEMKLKQWADAMRSFETCYRDFPNEGADRGNIYQKMALLKWGEAAMGAEDRKLALQLFDKFLDERDRERDVFPLGSFHINTAVCHYKLGHISEGNESLEIAIRNKGNFPTPDVGIVAGFQELVSAAIVQRDEQVLLDFIGKNRGELVIDPLEMRHYNGVFLKLAGDALAAGMTRAALSVYQFVPDEDGAAGVKLTALALIHEKAGNLRGAHACYRQVDLHHPDAANRGETLYHLVRTASLMGETETARDYARRLFRDFPQSPRLAEIRATGIDFPEVAAVSPVKPPAPVVEEAGAPLPVEEGFAAAMDLYQGRRYREALQAFGECGSRAGVTDEVRCFALFYKAECLRKLGDLEGLAKALTAVEKRPALGSARQRQLEIGEIWENRRLENWVLVARRADTLISERLPGDQRAQLAYLRALACKHSGQADEALDFYNTAMTADAGASEELAREAALEVLRIHHDDPDVRDAMANWKEPDYDRGSRGFLRLREAAGVAALFQLSLGAGVPLPPEFAGFSNYR